MSHQLIKNRLVNFGQDSWKGVRMKALSAEVAVAVSVVLPLLDQNQGVEVVLGADMHLDASFASCII